MAYLKINLIYLDWSYRGNSYLTVNTDENEYMCIDNDMLYFYTINYLTSTLAHLINLIQYKLVLQRSISNLLENCSPEVNGSIYVLCISYLRR